MWGPTKPPDTFHTLIYIMHFVNEKGLKKKKKLNVKTPLIVNNILQ